MQEISEAKHLKVNLKTEHNVLLLNQIVAEPRRYKIVSNVVRI